MLYTNSKLVSLLILSTALVACGGGGGGGGSSDNNTAEDNPSLVINDDTGSDNNDKPGNPAPVADTTPDNFTIVDVSDVDLAEPVTSAPLSISGFNIPISIAIAGGEYAINGGDFTSEAGTLEPGASISLRLTASDTFNTTNSAVLTVGGVSDSFDVTTRADTSAPLAVIQYPPVKSLTDQALIEVRGVAEDLEGSPITSVSVNGFAAESSDGFATWNVTIPLELGDNALVVETADDKNNVDDEAAEALVKASAYPFLLEPNEGSVAVDSDNNRALVVDSALEALFAFDLSTGERTVISAQEPQDNFGAQAPVGGGINLRNPGHLVFDPDNNRVLVTEQSLGKIIAIDLATGERSEFLNRNTGGSGPGLTLLRSQVLDLANNRVLVMDGVNGNIRLFAVDLTTGNRMIISSAGRGSGQVINSAEAIALDTANNRLLAADGNNGLRGTLLAIDLNSGNRTVLSGLNRTNNQLVGAGPEFFSPQSLDFDSDNGRVLIADSSFETVFTVNLATGERTVITGTVPNTTQQVGVGPKFIALIGTAFLDERQAVAVDRELETVMVIDLTNGDRRLLPGNAIGEGPRFNTPRGFVQLGEPSAQRGGVLRARATRA